MTTEPVTSCGEDAGEPENNGVSYNLAQFWTQITTKFIEEAPANKSDSEMSPIVILGNTYHDIELAEKDVWSKICLTYRFGFTPIPRSSTGPNPLSFLGSIILSKNLLFSSAASFGNLMDSNNFTSDVGWGCMIRTSQSLLANTYLRLMASDNDNTIIDMFQDNDSCPYSLHKFVSVAGELPLKVQPGEWFGPNAASLSISRLCQANSNNNSTPLPNIDVLVSDSGDLYDDMVLEKFGHDISGVLVLLPVRLGIDQINSYYYKSLLHFLSLKQSVGIAGGKPSSSYYFVGYQDQDLFYLNPHFSQNYSDTPNYESYHTKNYQKLPLTNLDPSMMIGVLITSPEDYADFKNLCVENGNKIVHFHPMSKAERKRRNSEFVTINDEDTRDEFIDIKYDLTQNDEDFVDLGRDINDDAVASTPEDHMQITESFEAINNDSKYQELLS
jgi:cysteine protease ATG4